MLALHIPFTFSIFFSPEFLEVQDLYIKAAQVSPHDPDPDVQCGLGVIFNLASQYEKAIDCFQVVAMLVYLAFYQINVYV